MEQPDIRESRILLRVNAPAFAVGSFEAAMGFAFTAFSARAMGDPADANLLLFWFWLSLFVFELPTGYVVDRWGAKGSLVGSLLLRSMAFALYFWGEGSTIALCAASVLAGLAVTFMSGLFSTQIMVWSSQSGLTVDTRRMMRWVMVVRSGSLVAGSSLGYLATVHFGLDSVWLLCTAMALATLVYVLLLWPRLRAGASTAMGTHYRSCAGELTRRRMWNGILKVSVVRIVSMTAMSNAAMVLVPGLERTPVLLLALQWLSGAIMLFVPRVASHVDSRPLGHRSMLWIFLPALMALPFLATWAAWLGFAVMLASAIYAEMHYRARFYDAMDASMAGSATSIQGLVENAMGAMAFGASWLFLQLSAPRFIWLLYAVMTLAFAVAPRLLHGLGRSSKPTATPIHPRRQEP